MTTPTRKPLKPLLSWADILAIMPKDDSYPANTRMSDHARLKKALSWNEARTLSQQMSPVSLPSRLLNLTFTHESIDRLFAELTSAELGLTDKTLANTHSVCRRIAMHYGAPTTIGRVPLTSQLSELKDLINIKWHQQTLSPFFHFLSYMGYAVSDVDDSVSAAFEKVIPNICRQADPRRVFLSTIRIWNECVENVSGWPQTRLTNPAKPATAAINWADFPELRDAIDAYLACGHSVYRDLQGDHNLEINFDDDDELIQPLEAASVRNNKKALARVVWSLTEEKISSSDLRSLRDICEPKRFRQAIRVLVARAGGLFNRTIANYERALVRLARHPGVLTIEELKNVELSHKRYMMRYANFKKTYESRDQETLRQLDDPSVMDAFLSLPTRTKTAILSKRGPATIFDAYAIQRALALELWLCVPWRIGAFVNLELDQIVVLHLDGVDRVLVRGPKQQAQGKSSPEHFLSADAISLLRLYVSEYRPIILRNLKQNESAYIFPGREC